MHTKFARAIALSGMALFLFSCSKDSLVQKPLKEDIRGISSLDKVVLHHCESNTKLAFSADVDWKIVNCPSWLTISGIKDLQGKLGTTILTFSTQPNLTGKKLSADIDFVEVGGDGNKLATLNVSQDAVVFELDVKDKTLNYQWHDHQVTSSDYQGDKTIKINSNIFWLFQENNLHDEATQLFTFSKPEGENATEVQVVPTQPNFTRDTTVIVSLIPMMKVNGDQGDLKPIEGLDPISFKLSQNHLLFLADWDVSTFWGSNDAALFSELGPNAASNSYKSVITAQTEALVHVNSVEPWVVTECPDWIELKVDEQKLSVLNTVSPIPAGEVQMHVKVLGANPELNTARSAVIGIAPQHKNSIDANGKYIVSRPIPVEQAPYQFEVSTDDDNGGFDFKNDAPNDTSLDGQSYGDDEHYSVHVKMSGTAEDCEVYNLPAWLQCSEPVLEESGGEWNKYVYTVSLKEQNLDFSAKSTGVSPVYFQQKPSLSQDNNVIEAHRAPINFSQAPFVFDFSMETVQTRGNTSYKMNDLPPALTAQKLMDRYNTLFNATASNITGEWELGPGTSDWLRVYLEEQMTPWTGEGINQGNKGGNIILFFAPWDANQNPQETAREGKLQLVSSRHLAKYGNYNSVPASAKREWTVTQRKFKYSVSPLGKSTDGAAFDNVPAYSSQFDNETVVMHVTCDGNWEIRQNELPSFLVTDPSTILSADGEEGEYDVMFHLKPNPQAYTVGGEIAVYCTDRNDQKKACSITQDAFVYDLAAQTIDQIPAYVQPGDDYNVQFHLTEGAHFKVEDFTGGSDSGWAGTTDQTATTSAGKNAYTHLYFHPQPNSDVNAGRSGYVRVTVIKPEGVPNASVDITFKQNPYYFNLSQSEDLLFSELDKSVKNFSITSSGPWTLTPNRSWIHVTPSSGIGSESPVEIQLNVDENTQLTERNDGQVSLRASILPSANTQSFDVRQEAFQWDVIDQSDGTFNYTFDPLEIRSVSFKIKSSGAWSMTGVPSWITVNPSSGNGNEDGSYETITITSQKNLSTSESDRSLTTFRFVSTKLSSNNDLQKSVSMKQNPFIWKVTGADSALSWDSPLSTDGKSIVVQSSGGWYVTSGNKSSTYDNSGHWLWSDVEGNGAAKSITLTPSSVNNSFNDANAHYYVVSKEHKDAGKTLQSQVACFQPKYVLDLGQSTLNFNPWNKTDENARQQQNVSVNCTTANWKVETEELWIQPVKESHSVSVKVDNYNGSAAKSGTVKVVSTDTGIDLFREISVNQSGFVFKTSNDNDNTQTIQTQGIGGKTVNIDCSASFSVKSIPDFVTWASGSENGQLIFSVAKNTNGSSRTGNIVLTSHEVDLPISVKQYPYLFQVTGVTDGGTTVMSPAASQTEIELKVSSNVPWGFSIPSWLQADPNYLNYTPTNGETATNYSLKIKAKSNNLTAQDMVGTIQFTNDIVANLLSCDIKQNGFEFGELDLDAFEAYGSSSLSQKFNFASSIPWTAVVTAGNDWISLDKSSGTGGSTVQIAVTAGNNLVQNERSGTIVISNAIHEGITRTIAVQQKAFVFSVTPAEKQVFVAASATKTFTVNCSSDYGVSVNRTWLHVSKNGNTVTLTVDENTGDLRTGTLTVNSAVGGYSQGIEIEQNGVEE